MASLLATDTSQSMTLSSRLPEASILPSGLKLTDSTDLSCPAKVREGCRFLRQTAADAVNVMHNKLTTRFIVFLHRTDYPLTPHLPTETGRRNIAYGKASCEGLQLLGYGLPRWLSPPLVFTGAVIAPFPSLRLRMSLTFHNLITPSSPPDAKRSLPGLNATLLMTFLPAPEGLRSPPSCRLPQHPREGRCRPHCGPDARVSCRLD